MGWLNHQAINSMAIADGPLHKLCLCFAPTNGKRAVGQRFLERLSHRGLSRINSNQETCSQNLNRYDAMLVIFIGLFKGCDVIDMDDIGILYKLALLSFGMI